MEKNNLSTDNSSGMVQTKTKTNKTLLVLAVLFSTLFISFSMLLGGGGASGTSDTENCRASEKVNETVKKLEPKIRAEMDKQGLEISYLPYILAMLNQESGGRGSDPFQASESKCGSIGCINNVDESIEAGIKAFNGKVKLVKKLKLKPTAETILQSYNYGGGYLTWLVKNDYKEYSSDNAKEFSKQMCGQAGTSPASGVNEDKSACYGDYDYIKHVKRYLDCTKKLVSFDGTFVSPYDTGKIIYITQKYANPSSMYGNGYHIGMDLDGGSGANIRSVASGKVVKATQHGSAGYGTYVMIQSRKDLYIIYGHMISGSLTVKVGDIVNAGQKIGEQGNTGYSFGSHLHLEFRKISIEFQELRWTYDPNSFIDFKKFSKKYY